MAIYIRFLGATGTVTGSRFLIGYKGRQYLVDCGLFQGGRQQKALNWEPFSISPDRIEAVFITHAHIDHTGYLPRLVREGFHGPVYATEATGSLLEILLPDSAYLQEQDAAYANKSGHSRYKPALPLYNISDAQQTLQLLHRTQFNQPLEIDGLTVTWRPAGHILGSAILEVEIPDGDTKKRVVFSGDLGRYDSQVMRPPVKISQADILLVESTYGDRLHANDSIQDILTDALDYVIRREGVLLIPAFAVGRTQEVLYHIRRLQEEKRVPDLPVFIDSPMAVEVSHIYCRFGDDHNLDINLLMDDRECPLRCHDTRFVQSVEESKQLNTKPGPAIIISASGMCNGGRIMHHLKWRLSDKRNVVLFVGYQAEGTRGRYLLEGAKKIRIHGETVPVRARIIQAHALSAHADRDEVLKWLDGFTSPPNKTVIVHGETSSSQALQKHIAEKFSWETIVPQMNDILEVP